MCPHCPIHVQSENWPFSDYATSNQSACFLSTFLLLAMSFAFVTFFAQVEGREKLNPLSNGLRSVCTDNKGAGSPFELS